MTLGITWKRFRQRLRYLTRHAERQRLLWEEMQFHIESMAQDLVARGMSEHDAQAAAHRKFGNRTRQSEESKAIWIAQWIDDAGHDLKHAVRGMRRDAGFTVFVILIVGLGIGASSTIFSVANALLLRPLPFRDPGNLVWIANQEWSTQVGVFLDLKERNKSFSDMAAFAGFGVGDSQLLGAGEPERLTRVPVTQNFFTLLGVQPMIGRAFTVEECRGPLNTPPAALLSYGFWRRRFASDPAVVGRKLTLDNKPLMIVGVLPASFDFASVFAPGTPIDVFIPWPLTAETHGHGNTLKVIGRLRAGRHHSERAGGVHPVSQTDRNPASRMERDPASLASAQTICQRTRKPRSLRADLCCRSAHVDRVRKSLQSAIGAPGVPAKGDGYAVRSRRGASPPPSSNAHGERRSLLLRRSARPPSRSGRHARHCSPANLQYPSAR